MKTVHTGLHITDEDWDTSIKIAIGILDKFKVPSDEKDEILNAVSSLKNDIVGL